MNKILFILAIVYLPEICLAQSFFDSTSVFKKRVLETTELDILTSFYTQDGDNAAVTGGIGTEQLTDFATDIKVSIPLNDDDVLTIDGTISAYSSASSSNLNPFSGASSGYDDDDDNDDDYDDNVFNNGGTPTGSPWYASTGASKKDTWMNLNMGYSHSSDNRNTIFSSNLSFANEYDYTSTGGGIGLVKLFNDKNTELSFNTSVYFDWWKPQYPTEIKTYINENGNLNADFFQGVDILDENGNPIDKLGVNAWKPINSDLVQNKNRNTYSISLGFSQILSQTTQLSVFSDFVIQKGWLANPMQRVYFADISNYYIGNASGIPFYTDDRNKDVFQLADDIERLPKSRIKIPVGVRINQYINEFLVIRTYYRYYFDDWGIKSHTVNVEIPVKLKEKFTLYPGYRFYYQSAADYFAPFEQNVSTSEYYTSDFDLSKFNSNQIGFGIQYTDIFTRSHLWSFGLKTFTLEYNYYFRNTGLKAQIISFGSTFILDK